MSEAPLLCRIALAVASLLFPVVANAQLADTPEEGDVFGRAVATGDFNGDGFDDLAIGVPFEGLGSIGFAGAAHIVYGTAAGLSDIDNQFWTQDSPGIDETAEATDEFGWALAAGDFNGDGFDDLAISAAGENFSAGSGNEGLAHILYGSVSGLTANGSQIWSQADPDVEDDAESGDAFGHALAAGDLDGDGFDDLAVSAPDEFIDDDSQAGAVNVFYGSAVGLTADRDEFWHLDRAGMPVAATAGDRFGRALAIGDFDGNGTDDLAVGIPLLDTQIAVPELIDAGGVVLLSWDGNSLAPDPMLWSQEVGTLGETADAGDSFGNALAASDFNGDGFDDLAIGVYEEGPNAGLAHAIYGSPIGLTTDGNQSWTQDSPGIDETLESGDYFAWGLAVGDANGDGFGDLAVGAPGETLNGVMGAGVVTVLPGSASGLTGMGSRTWQQGADGVLNTPNTDDTFQSFARFLVAGDFDGNGAAELAVASVGEDLPGIADVGAVNIITMPLAATDPAGQLLRQGSPIIVSTESGTFDLSEAVASLDSTPNPFRNEATLRYRLAQAGPVRLSVYDIMGREMALLANETQVAGFHVVEFEATNLPAGVYIVRLETTYAVQSHKVTLIR